MRIADIECIPIFAGWRNWLIVRVVTDTGLIGIGESTLEGREKTVAAAVCETGRRLKGRNPEDIEALYQLMYRGAYWRGGPILGSAISGIEQALWDLLGKHHKTPVYRLLGGVVRTKIPVYASGWFRPEDRTVDALVKRAVQIADEGFRIIKTPCFLPWETCVSEQMLERGMELVAELRRALEPKVELLVEMHSRYPLDLCLRALKQLEKHNLGWIEEPCQPENPDVLARLSRSTRLPMASGERLVTRFAYRPLIEKQLVTVLQPDLCHIGGILEAKKLAAMAEVYSIDIAPHNPLSPVSTAACVHFAISTTNFRVLEYIPHDVPWREAVFPATFYEFKDGYLQWEDRPGLGVDIDLDQCRKHPYRAVDLEVGSTPDGSYADW
jgi:galactonate dehydratase